MRQKIFCKRNTHNYDVIYNPMKLLQFTYPLKSIQKQVVGAASGYITKINAFVDDWLKKKKNISGDKINSNNTNHSTVKWRHMPIIIIF